MDDSTMLVTRLKAIGSPRVISTSPPAETKIAALERRFHVALPADFRAALVWSDGIAIHGDASKIQLYGVDDLEFANLDEGFLEDLPDMFVFGDDGDGSIYFYDPQNKLNLGAYAVYMVKQDQLGFDQARHCGDSISVMVHDIVGGVRLSGFPAYKTEPPDAPATIVPDAPATERPPMSDEEIDDNPTRRDSNRPPKPR